MRGMAENSDPLREHWDVIEAAIGKVVSRYRMSGADADDLRSELWLYLVADGERAIARFRGESCLETYLFGICLRAASRWKRKQVRRTQVELQWDTQTAEDAQAGRTISDQQLRNLYLQELRESMRIIPSRDRRFLLMRLEGHSFQDIASSCGSPIRTVQTAVTRARKTLREAFAQIRPCASLQIVSGWTERRPA